MKIRRLPETDLARIAPLPEVEQRNRLRQIRDIYPPLSYGPLRSCFPDLFNIQYEMLGSAERTLWSTISGRIEKASKTEIEFSANIQVALALHDFSTRSDVIGFPEEFFPLHLSRGGKVMYWLDVILNLEGVPLIPFVDPRRTYRLTREGRRFAFSMMNERIRVADPKLEHVQFGIFQFGDPESGRRAPTLHKDEGVELFGFEELESMVSRTYRIWWEICEEREAEARRRASGLRGDLL